MTRREALDRSENLAAYMPRHPAYAKNLFSVSQTLFQMPKVKTLGFKGPGSWYKMDMDLAAKRRQVKFRLERNHLGQLMWFQSVDGSFLW